MVVTIFIYGNGCVIPPLFSFWIYYNVFVEKIKVGGLFV